MPMRFSGAMERLNRLQGREFDEIKRVFLKDGKAYAPGEVLRQPELAATLRRIVEDGREGFYDGETADLIAQGDVGLRRPDRAEGPGAGAGALAGTDHDDLRRLRRLRAAAAVAGHRPADGAEHRRELPAGRLGHRQRRRRCTS